MARSWCSPDRCRVAQEENLRVRLRAALRGKGRRLRPLERAASAVLTGSGAVQVAVASGSRASPRGQGVFRQRRPGLEIGQHHTPIRRGARKCFANPDLARRRGPSASADGERRRAQVGSGTGSEPALTLCERGFAERGRLRGASGPSEHGRVGARASAVGGRVFWTRPGPGGMTAGDSGSARCGQSTTPSFVPTAHCAPQWGRRHRRVGFASGWWARSTR